MTLHTLFVVITFNEASVLTEKFLFSILNDDRPRYLAIWSAVLNLLRVKVYSRPHQHVKEEKCRGPAGQLGRRVH